VNSTVQRKEAVLLLDQIADLVANYRVREGVYRSSLSQQAESEAKRALSKEVEEKTIGLYEKILTSELLLGLAYARSGFLQYMRDVVKYDDWRKLGESLRREDQIISDAVKVLGESLTLSIAGEVRQLSEVMEKLVGQQGEEQQQQIDKMVKALVAHEDDREKISCLRALSSKLDYRERRNRVAERVPSKLGNPHSCPGFDALLCCHGLIL
jgi:hypothetical protein